MTTARVLIVKAMKKAGILTKSEQPAADEANDAFDDLNFLMDSWSNYNANIYSRTRETFNLTSAASYTIGDGQTFDTERPIQIVEGFTSGGGVDYSFTIVNQENYDSIVYKNIPGIPEYLTYNSAFPVGTITLFPSPTGVATITLLMEQPINQFASLDTVVSMPPGWKRALINNLAVILAPEYSQPVTPAMDAAAKESLGAIKLAVVRSRPVLAFPGAGFVRNIYTGYRI